MYPKLKEAAGLKKIAFAKLDQGHKGVTVSPNLLIDIILAYESAAEGDTENLNYALGVASKRIQKYEEILEQIADKLNPDEDEELWNLAMTYV